MSSTTHIPLPSLHQVSADDPAAGYESGGFAALSDAHLLEMVAGVIARPKREAADSFVLHAPLELLARAALLPMVEPERREEARRRLVWLAAAFERAGEPVSDPVVRPFRDADHAAERMLIALGEGDGDEADAAVRWLVRSEPVDRVADLLAASVLPRLSAAAHGNIAVHQLPRVAARDRALAAVVHNLVRELARYPEPDWNLTWYAGRSPAADAAPVGAGRLLQAALVRPGPVESPSNFIFPTMSAVERGGLAADLLDGPTRGLSVREARRVLLRLAAHSMLQDDPAEAPYGWTHCLSLPQAALGVAHRLDDPGDAVAVAATYVLGFRATLATVTVDPGWVPERPHHGDPLGALEAEPLEAAAAAWHADRDLLPALRARLAGRASAHTDAHLVKYTLACLDAAADDPDAAPLFLAAAAYLQAWWAAADRAG